MDVDVPPDLQDNAPSTSSHGPSIQQPPSQSDIILLPAQKLEALVVRIKKALVAFSTIDKSVLGTKFLDGMAWEMVCDPSP
jgi:hypothetical protein